MASGILPAPVPRFNFPPWPACLPVANPNMEEFKMEIHEAEARLRLKHRQEVAHAS